MFVFWPKIIINQEGYSVCVLARVIINQEGYHVCVLAQSLITDFCQADMLRIFRQTGVLYGK